MWNLQTAVVITALVAAAFALDKQNRKVEYEYNPNCPMGIDCSRLAIKDKEDFDSRQNLLYIRAEGQDDTTHALLSTIGTPSMLLLSSNAELKGERVNVTHWTRLARPGGWFELELPIGDRGYFVQTFRLNRLFAFDDLSDKADIGTVPDNDTRSIDLSALRWLTAKVDGPTNETQQTSFTVCTNPKAKENAELGDGQICIRAVVYGTAGRDLALPRLLHESDSIQLSVSLDGLPLSFGEYTRYALELWFSSDPADGPVIKTVDATFDDEYTPGVFQVNEVLYPGLSGHVLWKPVAYTQAKPDRAHMTRTNDGPIQDSEYNPESGLVYAMWQHHNWTQHPMFALNLTIGKPKDGYYAKTNYTVWSASAGLGVSPDEQMSVLLLLILILIGLAALICLIIVLVFVCTCCVRMCHRRSGAQQDTGRLITDDDMWGEADNA